MTNIQLYLTIGIPTLTVILAWITSGVAASRNQTRIDQVDARIDKIDAKLEAFRAEMRASLDAFRAEVRASQNTLMGYMIPLHERMAKIEEAGK